MISTKLICIDGISGSGKSTTSQRLCLHLIRNGHEARWLYEHGTANPIWRAEERFRLTESGISDPRIVHDLVVSRWRKLAADLAGCGRITVMESSLFNTTTNVMLAMNFDEPPILDCLREVEQAVVGLGAVSIYFYPNDVRQALRAICNERRHDQFEGPLIELFSRTSYAKTHGLCGFEGLVRFFENGRRITDLAFDRFKISKLAIDYSAREWLSYERRITDFLGLPEMPPILEHIDRPTRFPGRYKDPDSDSKFVVAADNQGLYLDDARRTRLIHEDGTTFYINALWVEITFEEEREGSFQRLRVKGDLPDLAPVWVRE